MKENRFSEALSTLDEAMGRVGERPDDLRIAPFLESGYAQVYWAQAQDRLSAGDPAGARDALDQVRTHAQAAIDGDRRLAPAYLMLAKANEQARNYDDALQVLNRGLAVAELINNTELIMEKAQIYFVQRDYEHALHQAFLALYIDPTIEAAYQLKIQIALARSRPGDAVLAAEDYLHFYPGSTTAFRLLGDARVAEHKDDLALAAYTQGLSANGTDADCLKMLEGRAKIYERQRRYALAVDDYDRLYTLTRDRRFRALRMQAAFAAGKFDLALSDADILAASIVLTPEVTAEPGVTPTPAPQAAADSGDVVSAGEVALVRGASMIEQAQPGDTTSYTQAAQLLTQALASSEIAFSPQRGTASEYLARAQLALGDSDAALTAINAALAASETGSRHYWRGQILQAKGDNAAAARDYEWVLSWSEVFPYPFRVDAQDRLDGLGAVLLPTPTTTPRAVSR
jgi:tetratricopeptide (TPR) repeat protein